MLGSSLQPPCPVMNPQPQPQQVNGSNQVTSSLNSAKNSNPVQNSQPVKARPNQLAAESSVEIEFNNQTTTTIGNISDKAVVRFNLLISSVVPVVNLIVGLHQKTMFKTMTTASKNSVSSKDLSAVLCHRVILI